MAIDKKLDKACSEIAKKRAGYKCEYCGSGSYVNAHHVVGRRNKAVRWELTNLVCLCAKHHTFSSEFSAHQTPTIFAEWIIGVRGQEWHDGLVEMSRKAKKWTKAEKEELLKEFKECLCTF
jgi:hypothetical protein